MFRPDREGDGLFKNNARFKRDNEEPFHSILLFAREDGFSYFYATVPGLADAQGIQPIVHTSYYPGEYGAVPIASSLDRFFDAYSRYLELMVVDAGYVDTGVSEISFPWSVPKLIAEDTALMKLIREGRFSHLICDDDEVQDWITKLLSIRI